MHQMGTEAFLGKINRFVTKSVTRRANTKWEEHRHLQPVRQGLLTDVQRKWWIHIKKYYPAIEGTKSCNLKLDKTEGKAGQRHNLAYPCNIKIYPCNEKNWKMLLEIRSGGLVKGYYITAGWENSLGLLYGRLTKHEDDNVPRISIKAS